MSKFLGFLLGVAVALAGPAVFGVLSAPGGIQLNTKEMALAYGVGALVFWAIVSYFSGAGAIGAFLAFGTLVYCWLWIPNRTTNFLNDVPGVTNGMVEGTRQYTLNGLVPILTVITLIYSIQLIVRSVQRRRRARVEAERLQREQEAAQAQQEAAAAAVYPVAASTYPAEQYAVPSYEPSSRYDDLFDEEPERPRSQADEQTAQFPVAESAPERTSPFPAVADDVADGNDETVLVPSDADETVVAARPEADEVTVIADEPAAADEETREHPAPAPVAETSGTPTAVAPAEPVAAVAADEREHAAAPAASTPVAAAPGTALPEHAAEQTAVAEPAAADEETREHPAPAAEPVAAEPATRPAPESPSAPTPEHAAEQTAVAEPVAAESPADDETREFPGAGGGFSAPMTGAPVGGTPGAGAGAPAAAAPIPAAPIPAGADDETREYAAEDEPAHDPEDERFHPPASGGGNTPTASAEPQHPKATERRADVGWQAASGFEAAPERVGQQYRERMEDPEDTGEFHVSAFEGPFNSPGIRPAGA